MPSPKSPPPKKNYTLTEYVKLTVRIYADHPVW